MGFAGGQSIPRFGVIGAMRNRAVIPGRRIAASPEPMNTTLLQFVMLALVARIHVLNTAFDQRRRGWSGQARP